METWPRVAVFTSHTPPSAPPTSDYSADTGEGEMMSWENGNTKPGSCVILAGILAKRFR